eukprot:g2726.t1
MSAETKERAQEAPTLKSLAMHAAVRGMRAWLDRGFESELKIERLRRELLPTKEKFENVAAALEEFRAKQAKVIPRVRKAVKKVQIDVSFLERQCRIVDTNRKVNQKLQFIICRLSAVLVDRLSAMPPGLEEEKKPIRASDIWANEVDDALYDEHASSAQYVWKRVKILLKPDNIVITKKLALEILEQIEIIKASRVALSELRRERDALVKSIHAAESEFAQLEIVHRSRQARLRRARADSHRTIGPGQLRKHFDWRSRTRRFLLERMLSDLSDAFREKIASSTALWPEETVNDFDPESEEKKKETSSEQHRGLHFLLGLRQDDDSSDDESEDDPRKHPIELDLTDCRVKRQEIAALAFGLRESRVEALNLSRNRIGKDAFMPLAHELRFCTSLKSLDLSWNALNHECIVALAKACSPSDDPVDRHFELHVFNVDLEHLNLAGNSIGFLGSRALRRIIDVHPALSSLNLFHAGLEAAGGIEIAKSLASNTTLRHLNLRYNNLTQKGADAIGKAMKTNETLEELKLADNHFGREGVMSVYNGMRKRPLIDLLRTLGYTPGHPLVYDHDIK